MIIADIDRARAEALSAELPGSSVLILDITNEAAVAEALGAIGQLDILVNCAGSATWAASKRPDWPIFSGSSG